VALGSLSDSLRPKADEYSLLQSPVAVSRDFDGSFVVDLLATRDFLNKSLVGLVTGTFLTIRSKRESEGAIGTIRQCPKCLALADQEHFLNVCSVNMVPRKIISGSVPSNFLVEHLASQDFYSFYRNIRSLKVKVLGVVDELDPIPASLYLNLAQAASSMASLFTRNTLALLGSN